MSLNLDEAKELIRQGCFFGDVYPMLDDELDRCDLREWFVRDGRVPTADAVAERTAAIPPAAAPDPPCERPLKEISGRPAKQHRTTFIDLNPCTNCGCSEFVPGACPACANCGQSSGGCG